MDGGVSPSFFKVFLTQCCLPDFQFATDFFVHYRWNNISILKFENLKLETLNFETLNFETLNFEIWYFDISLFSSSENCHSTTAWQGGNTKEATHRLPCVNLFIGFDLSHAPPKAVLVILVDAVGEGVLQEPDGRSLRVHVVHNHNLVPVALIRAEGAVATGSWSYYCLRFVHTSWSCFF